MADDEIGKLYPVAKKVITPLFNAAWRFRIEGLEHIPTSGGAINGGSWIGGAGSSRCGGQSSGNGVVACKGGSGSLSSGAITIR